jgi:hypothetical protein
MEDARAKLRALLKSYLPRKDPTPEHLEGLIREGYVSEEDFSTASRDGLRTAGLPSAMVDGILAAVQGELL